MRIHHITIFLAVILAGIVLSSIACIYPCSADTNQLQVTVTSSPEVYTAGGSCQIHATVTYNGQPAQKIPVQFLLTGAQATISPASGSADGSGSFSATLTTTSSSSGVIHVLAQARDFSCPSTYVGAPCTEISAEGFVDIPQQVQAQPQAPVFQPVPQPQPYQPPLQPVIQPPPQPVYQPPQQPVNQPQQPATSQQPVAVINVDRYAGNMPLDIMFDGRKSYAPGGSIVMYAWDFGDGSTGRGYVAQHQYTNPGTFTASLVVTDNNERSSIPATIQITGGSTVQAPVYNIGGSCDDGNKCTVNDKYDASGKCIAGQPLNCDDNDPNTADSCDPAIGCAHTHPVSILPAVVQADTGSVQKTGAEGQLAASVASSQNDLANLMAELNKGEQKYDYYYILDVNLPKAFNEGTTPESRQQGVPQMNNVPGSESGQGGKGGQPGNPFTSPNDKGPNSNLNPMEGNPYFQIPGIKNDLNKGRPGYFPGMAGSVERQYGPIRPGIGPGLKSAGGEGWKILAERAARAQDMKDIGAGITSISYTSDSTMEKLVITSESDSGGWHTTKTETQLYGKGSDTIHKQTDITKVQDVSGDVQLTKRVYTQEKVTPPKSGGKYESPEGGNSEPASGYTVNKEADYELTKQLMYSPPSTEREGLAPWVNPVSRISSSETQPGTGQSAQTRQIAGSMITAHGYFPHGWVPFQRMNLPDPNPESNKASAATSQVYVPALLLPDPVPIFG